MARVRICPSCSHINEDMRLMNCAQCEVSISDVTPTESSSVEVNSSSPAPPDRTVPPAPSASRQSSAAPVVATHVGYELAFPWGKVPVAGCLNVGREQAFSTIAIEVQKADTPETVSRKHATLHIDRNGVLQLRDVGATNATYVNGEAITPGCSIGLGESDEVSFSRSLKATVHRAR